LQPIEEHFDSLPLRQVLCRFSQVAGAAEPAEMQRIVRATVHKVVWQPSGERVVDFYTLPQTKSAAQESSPLSGADHLDLWLERNVRYGSP
jgi:hypothetical protein